MTHQQTGDDAMQHYRTDRPNDAHLLMVSASKHYYLGSDGLLKYQKKPMEITLAKLPASPRRHMVIYTLRDHFSAVRYMEIGFAPELPPLRAFLARAWGPKADSPFQGLPEVLTWPNTVDAAFPGVAQAVKELGVEVIPSGSGFKGGVRDTLDVERAMYGVGKPPNEAVAWLAKWWVLSSARKLERTGQVKIEMWSQYVPAIKLPPSGWTE
jgi:hypothetical protein